MKTKFLFRSMALAAVAAFTLSACNKADEKPTSENMKTVEGSMKIAYVEVDSIMEKYTFCKEYKAILDARSKKVENELAAQQQNRERAAQAFQNKLQNNGFTSRAEAENQQAALVRQQQNLESSAQRLQSELLQQTDEFNKALHDSLQHFLEVYNKDKKLSMILTKQGDNILLADKAFDITDEVIAGLNKAYKPNSSKAGEKKELKKEEKKEEVKK